MIRNKRGFSLAEVELIGSYQFRLKLKVPNAPGVEIARARVTLNSLVGVLSEVLIYNISYTPKIYFSDYFRQDNILAKNEILVYPNPASEMLMVQKADNNTDDTDIYIYASDGKLMLQELHHSENIISIKINTLPDGMYILNAKSGNELYTKTFIVEN
ncbi:MAG: T9SS type A sorting domain-containing protein [Bacteroidetes bacterium]|nr:T9SS type A sorting domain-containing protein [Bacteroidota bacterium]